MSTLTCPKCGSEMRNYERNQVHVDQCTGCGGLFLDRGELEALVNAETAWYQPPAQGQQGQQSQPQQQAPPAAAPQQPAYRQGQYEQPYGQPAAQGYGQAPRYSSSPGKYGYGQPGYRRKKSFLSELFD
ncbi:zf-TFIIB domain-containing protein [Knoellia subterranea]|nr:zf-TFIIB domain-containing protein [Knoellia subterranea]